MKIVTVGWDFCSTLLCVDALDSHKPVRTLSSESGRFEKCDPRPKIQSTNKVGKYLLVVAQPSPSGNLQQFGPF